MKHDSSRSLIHIVSRNAADSCGGGPTFSRHIAPFVDMKGQNYLSLVIMSNFLLAHALRKSIRERACSIDRDA